MVTTLLIIVSDTAAITSETEFVSMLQVKSAPRHISTSPIELTVKCELTGIQWFPFYCREMVLIIFGSSSKRIRYERVYKAENLSLRNWEAGSYSLGPAYSGNEPCGPFTK